jgi:hypothetical protein
MTILSAMGFEHGSAYYPTLKAIGSASATAIGGGDSADILGAYKGFLHAAHYYFDQDQNTQSEIYGSMWVKRAGSGFVLYFKNASDATICYFTIGGGFWKFWRNGGALLATGTIPVVDSIWHLFEFHIVVHDAAGVVTTKVDGTQDIDISGADTMEGALDPVYWTMVSNGTYMDNIAFSDSDWLGDLRSAVLVPDSDDAVTWDRSAGGDNYALVDEVPYSDSDYNYTTVDAEQDLFTLGAWDDTDLTDAIMVVHHTRMKNDGSGDTALILNDGTEDSETKTLTGSYVYYGKDHPAPPSGGAWTNAVLDALKAGYESVIP